MCIRDSPGESLSINGARSVNTYSFVTGVVKPITPAPCYLWAVDPFDNSSILIGIYEPGETQPSYRQYYSFEIASRFSGAGRSDPCYGQYGTNANPVSYTHLDVYKRQMCIKRFKTKT